MEFCCCSPRSHQVPGTRIHYSVIKRTTAISSNWLICRNQSHRQMLDKYFQRKFGNHDQKVKHGPIHQRNHIGHRRWVVAGVLRFSILQFNSYITLFLLQGNCIWKSATGKYLHLKKTHLHELNDVERKNLQRIALDRINQLNIGVPVKLPSGEFVFMNVYTCDVRAHTEWLNKVSRFN